MNNYANFVADIQAKINDFMAGVRKVQAAANGLPDEISTDYEFDSGAATALINKLKANLRSIPNKIRTRIDVDTDGEGINSVSKSISGMMSDFKKAEMGSKIFKASLMAISPAAIPVIASLVPAIMAVGNALAVVGGGAIGLAGAFGIAGAGAAAFGFMAASAIKMFNDGLIESSAATQGFQTSISLLKSTWQGIVAMNADSIFGAMAKGATAATFALTALTPFLSKTAALIDQTAMKLVTWVRSSDTAKAAFSMLNTTGVSIFRDILAAAGMFGDGLVNILTQFAPLFEFVSGGLRNMAASFQEWANSTSTATGIQTFIEYVKTNLPVIGSIFGNVFTGIFNLFTAFGSNSQTIFGALDGLTAKFAAWSATVGQSQGFKQFIDYVQTQGPVIMSTIGSIVQAVIAFATAMAPVGAAVLSVVSSIAQWVASFATAHPQITAVVGAIIMFAGAALQIVSVLAPIISGIISFVSVVMKIFNAVRLAATGFALLSNPIGIAVVAIGLIIAAVVLAYQKFEWFRNFVNGLGQMFVTLGQMWMNGVNMIVQGIVTGFTNVITFIQGFSTLLMTILGAGWQILVTTIQTTWTTITTVITAAISIVTGILSSFGAMISGVFTAAWTGLVAIVQTVWTGITTAIQTAISVVTSVVSAGFNATMSVVTSVMSTIGSAVSSAWSAITSAIGSAMSAVGSAVSSGFNAMLSVASSVMSSISSAISSAWSAITSAIGSAISGAVSTVSSGFSSMISAVTSFASSVVSSITSAMSSFVSAVTSGASQALSAITSGLSSMISAITGFVGNMASAGADLVRGFINGITGMIGDAVAAAGRMASAAVDKVKSFLHIGSPSKVLKQIGAWMTQGFALGIEKDIPKVRTATQKLFRTLTSAINKMKSTDYSKSVEGARAMYDFINEPTAKMNEKLKRLAKERKDLEKKIAKSKTAQANARTWKEAVNQANKRAKMEARIAKINKVAKSTKEKRNSNRDLKREVRAMQIYMTRIAKKREEIAAKLDKAKEKLQKAIDKRNDFKSMIKDDLRGFASITNTGRKTAQGMAKMMSNRLTEMKKYYMNIEKLKAMGINKSTLKEILDSGIETGGSLAKGLVVGGASAVAEINNLQSEINRVSTKMGEKNATDFYQAGVDAAQGIVKGLQSQDKALKKVAEKLASVITTTIKKKLKIHSPSRAMIDLMGYVGAGLVNGLRATTSKVATASSRIATAIEDNVKPDMGIAPFDVDGGTTQMKRAVSSTLDANVQNGVELPNQNITVVIKSEHDIPMLTHAIEQVQGVNAAVNVVGY